MNNQSQPEVYRSTNEVVYIVRSKVLGGDFYNDLEAFGTEAEARQFIESVKRLTYLRAFVLAKVTIKVDRTVVEEEVIDV